MLQFPLQRQHPFFQQGEGLFYLFWCLVNFSTFFSSSCPDSTGSLLKWFASFGFPLKLHRAELQCLNCSQESSSKPLQLRELSTLSDFSSAQFAVLPQSCPQYAIKSVAAIPYNAAPIPVLIRVTTAVTKHHEQKQFGMKIYIWLRLPYHKLLLKEVRTGP